ncbi:hypothetical protein FWH58_01875 [Candidatus Saccharibacteria bacterium]|nr:hypothetical protein [Candidatus Saccharibacteria bacterium]
MTGDNGQNQKNGGASLLVSSSDRGGEHTGLSGDDNERTETLEKRERIVFVSDPHGSKRFEPLVKFALGMPSDVEFSTAEIEKAMQEANISQIIYMGDSIDRADDVVTMLEWYKMLIDLKTESNPNRSSELTGNHDVLHIGAGLGIAYPWYDNYRGINPNYKVRFPNGDEFDPNQWLRDQQKSTDLGEGIRDPKFWTQISTDYAAYADATQEDKWDRIYWEFLLETENVYGTELTKQNANGEVEDSKGNNILNFPDQYDDRDGSLKKFPKKLEWLGYMLGCNVGEFIPTGMRGVDKMSINWWLQRREELDELCLDVQSENESEYFEKWRILLDEEIIPQYQERLMQWYNEDTLDGYGNLAFDAINEGNYESVEWWLRDWVHHNEWAGGEKGLFAQVNNTVYKGEDYNIDSVNFMEDPYVQENVRLQMLNFKLYEIDEYGNLYTHGPLPLDGDGDIAIGYVNENGQMIYEDENGQRIKGVQYKGREYRNGEIFECWDEWENVIHRYAEDPTSILFTDVVEVFKLVYSMFADKSTLIKPSIISKNLTQITEKDYGDYQGPMLLGLAAGGTLEKLGITGAHFSGHNPIINLQKVNLPPVMYDRRGDAATVYADYGMAEKYGADGAVFIYDPNMGVIRYQIDKDGNPIEQIIVPPENLRGRSTAMGELAVAAANV